MGFVDLAIKDFNEGDFDLLETAFNDNLDSFLNYVDKKNKFDLINLLPSDSPFENELHRWVLNNKPELFEVISDGTLDDVKKIDGKWYFITNDITVLSELFCSSGRNYDYEKIVYNVLSDDDNSDYFSYEDVDIYSNVIDDLTSENLDYLVNRISKDLEGIEIEPTTDLLNEIAEEQNSKTVDVTLDVMKRIINDEKSTKAVLSNLYELENDLRGLYSSSSQYAYESELYNTIWNELSEYFDGKGEYFAEESPYNKEITKFVYKIQLRNFKEIIMDYLNDNANHYNSGGIANIGSIIGIIKEGYDCITFNISDYPDWTLIKKNINSNFKDYI